LTCHQYITLGLFTLVIMGYALDCFLDKRICDSGLAVFALMISIISWISLAVH
jgi:hypothetical protein